MSKKALTANKLIETIKRKSFVPTDDVVYTEEDYLEMMNHEMDVRVIPHLLSRYEEYMVETEMVTLESGVTSYEIPYRAAGNKLRDLFYVKNPDAPTPQQNIQEMHRIDPSEIYAYSNSYSFGNGFESGYLYYVKNNKINLLNEFPSGTGALKMDFYIQPNMLVLEKDAGKITSIDRVTGIVTLANFPTDFASLPSNKCDFVKSRSPNIILDWDVAVTSVNSSAKTVTFAVADIPDSLMAGDYICNTQESPFPNVPSELHSVLAQYVTISIMEALGDEQNKQSAERQLKAMLEALSTILDDRVDGSNKKIVNRHSPLSQSGFSRNRW